MNSQMDAIYDLKRSTKEKESEQLRNNEEASKRILASATGKRKDRSDDDYDDDASGISGGPKRPRNNVQAIELDNGLEAFGGSIEKSEASRLSI